MRRIIALMSLLALLVAGPASAADKWGDLKLQFVYDGTAPRPEKVNVNKDEQFCGKFNLVDESLVVDPKSKGIKNVVVLLYLSRGQKSTEVHPSYEESAKAEVELANMGCRFEPHVIALRTTQTLLITNPDVVGHNTKIDTLTNTPSNINLPAGGKVKQQFSSPERVVGAPAGCSIHPWMRSWLVIRDHPYMAVSDKDGNVVIKNLPAGEWTFQIWQEEAGYLSDVKVNNKTTKWTRGRVDLKIDDKKVTDLGVVKVSKSNFD